MSVVNIWQRKKFVTVEKFNLFGIHYVNFSVSNIIFQKQFAKLIHLINAT